ncbi:MAG TPA: hypothetical protein VHY59_03075 [Chthoniobacterales bacterium]|nr:hypothetical protein [Chthoniobacterales bacterium]
MARPPRSFHLQPINGGLRARVSVPVEVQDKIGKKVFYSPVWRVPETEAAKMAWPHVQKFEAMIEGARTGKFVPTVETEAPGPLQPLAPSFQARGLRNAATETTLPKADRGMGAKKTD